MEIQVCEKTQTFHVDGRTMVHALDLFLSQNWQSTCFEQLQSIDLVFPYSPVKWDYQQDPQRLCLPQSLVHFSLRSVSLLGKGFPTFATLFPLTGQWPHLQSIVWQKYDSTHKNGPYGIEEQHLALLQIKQKMPALTRVDVRIAFPTEHSHLLSSFATQTRKLQKLHVDFALDSKQKKSMMIFYGVMKCLSLLPCLDCLGLTFGPQRWTFQQISVGCWKLHVRSGRYLYSTKQIKVLLDPPNHFQFVGISKREQDIAHLLHLLVATAPKITFLS